MIGQLSCRVGIDENNLILFNPNDEAKPFLIVSPIFKGERHERHLQYRYTKLSLSLCLDWSHGMQLFDWSHGMLPHKKSVSVAYSFRPLAAQPARDILNPILCPNNEKFIFSTLEI